MLKCSIGCTYYQSKCFIDTSVFSLVQFFNIIVLAFCFMIQSSSKNYYILLLAINKLHVCMPIGNQF